MPHIDSTCNTVGDLFKSGHHFSPKQVLQTLESASRCYFIMDQDGGIVSYRTEAELTNFARMAIRDIRDSLWLPNHSDIARKFAGQYRTTDATFQLLETHFPVLKGDDFRPPVGNPRLWRNKFQDSQEEICGLLADERTNYLLLILPGTEFDVSQIPGKTSGVEFSSDRLVQVAHAYLDTYVRLNRDRWLKFFRYLHEHENSRLLEFWYPH